MELHEGCILGKVDFYSLGRLFCQMTDTTDFLSGKSANLATKREA